MNLNSFKELLIKKAEGNSELLTLINFIDNNSLADKLLESLEKMARPQASMGRSANAAITAFANQLKNKDVEKLRDALGHHISHYRSALQRGNREVADKHLNRVIPLMHLAARASAHSNGQLGLDYVPMEPWETNYTTTERRPETGKLKEGTKGLRRRLNSVSRDKNPRSVPDYNYLEMPPHEDHPDSKKMTHTGGYPFEEIQIGNPSKIDSGEAYLHLFDAGDQKDYVPHPFDMHPIHEHADKPHEHLNEDHLNDFAKKMTDWHTSDHSKQWLESIKEQHAKDPEAFKARGKTKPPHFFEGIQLKTQPHKATQNLEKPMEVSNSSPNELKQKNTQITQKPESTQTPKITQDTASHLPEALRRKFGV
jgi:hypothetical protein